MTTTTRTRAARARRRPGRSAAGRIPARRRRAAWIAAALVVASAGIAGARASAAAAGSPGALPLRADGSSILADVAARVSPAVVMIRTERSEGGGHSRAQGPWDLFREYFRDERGERPRFHDQGAGSGFVIDRQGRILTNHHVVRGADRITVVMQGAEYEAALVGADPLTDIAVIRIDPPEDVAVVPLGDSDAIRPGDWVMAIGTPFGELQGSVTAGIVSALGRSDLQIMGGTAIYQNYIQTDASINFGNSGGPLVNLRGEAVGINTAINPSGQGIGFAIPINMARRVVRQLLDTGHVAYGYLGIGLQALDRRLAEGRGLDIDHGIMVTQVLPDTPAHRAGLRKGDVIVRYDGEDVGEEAAFRMRVANTPVGTTVAVEVVRDGRRRTLRVRVGERPAPEALARAPQARPDAPEAWLGLRVDEADREEIQRRFGLERGQEGVVVTGVDPGSPAAEAGLREGDVITEVYVHEVRDLRDFVRVARKLEDRKAPIAFLVKRGRNSLYVTVTPGDE